MTNSITTLALLLSVSAVASFAQADDQDVLSPEEACDRAIDLFEERNKDYDSPLEPRQMCSFNARPASFWQCTEDQMREGLFLSDAMKACDAETEDDV